MPSSQAVPTRLSKYLKTEVFETNPHGEEVQHERTRTNLFRLDHPQSRLQRSQRLLAGTLSKGGGDSEKAGDPWRFHKANRGGLKVN